MSSLYKTSFQKPHRPTNVAKTLHQGLSGFKQGALRVLSPAKFAQRLGAHELKPEADGITGKFQANNFV